MGDRKFTERQVVQRLVRAVHEAGSQRAWAKANGLSAAYVNDVLRGHRQPGKSICVALGLRKETYYVTEYRAV